MSTDYLQLFITHRVGTKCVKCPFPATGIEQVQRYPHVIISCQDIVYQNYTGKCKFGFTTTQVFFSKRALRSLQKGIYYIGNKAFITLT